MIFNQQLRPDSFVMQLSTRSEFIVARFLSFRENQSWLERMKSSFSSFAARERVKQPQPACVMQYRRLGINIYPSETRFRAAQKTS